MKIAVVTGISYGIGKSIVKILLENDCKVYGLSRTKPDFTNEHFVWIQCDLSDHSQISKCLSAVREPEIDALVSNAGVIALEKPSAVSQTSYEETFSVNVLAPMLIVHELRHKIEHATIISISSISDRIPESDFALYSSSKAANTRYFNSLADELKNARVYTLLPDYVDTPMQHRTNDTNKNFDWSVTLKPEDIAQLSNSLISGNVKVESGANIIIINEKLKADLESVEMLYGFNVDTDELKRL